MSTNEKTDIVALVEELERLLADEPRIPWRLESHSEDGGQTEEWSVEPNILWIGMHPDEDELRRMDFAIKARNTLPPLLSALREAWAERDAAERRSEEQRERAKGAERQRSSLNADMVALRSAVDAVHLALGEAPESDDASLGEVVARRLRERDERIASLYSDLSACRAERDEARADLQAIDFWLDEHGAGNDALMHEHKGSIRRAAIKAMQWLRERRDDAESALSAERQRAEGAEEARSRLGEIAILALQGDYAAIREWATTVKVEFPDGAPRVPLSSPPQSHEDKP